MVRRKDYSIKIHRKTDAQLFYLDEMGFNLHRNPSFGYAPKGLTPTLYQPGNRGQNISVIACIGINGLVHWSAKDGAFNTDSYAEFLEDLCPLLPPGAILIMDNVQFHTANAPKRILRENAIESEFLPPYSPQLNPIEEFFSAIRARHQNMRPRPMDRSELYATVLKT